MPLVLDIRTQERLQIAPLLAPQGVVDLWFGAALGKRRHAQIVRKRPPRLMREGGLERLRDAGDGRAPYIQRAQ